MFTSTSDNLNLSLSRPISPSMLLASEAALGHGSDVKNPPFYCPGVYKLHLVSLYSQSFPRLLIHTCTNSDVWNHQPGFHGVPALSLRTCVGIYFYWSVLQNSGRSALLVTAKIFQRNGLHISQQVPKSFCRPGLGCLSPPPW